VPSAAWSVAVKDGDVEAGDICSESVVAGGSASSSATLLSLMDACPARIISMAPKSLSACSSHRSRLAAYSQQSLALKDAYSRRSEREIPWMVAALLLTIASRFPGEMSSLIVRRWRLGMLNSLLKSTVPRRAAAVMYRSVVKARGC